MHKYCKDFIRLSIYWLWADSRVTVLCDLVTHGWKRIVQSRVPVGYASYYTNFRLPIFQFPNLHWINVSQWYKSYILVWSLILCCCVRKFEIMKERGYWLGCDGISSVLYQLCDSGVHFIWSISSANLYWFWLVRGSFSAVSASVFTNFIGVFDLHHPTHDVVK